MQPKGASPGHPINFTLMEFLSGRNDDFGPSQNVSNFVMPGHFKTGRCTIGGLAVILCEAGAPVSGNRIIMNAICLH